MNIILCQKNLVEVNPFWSVYKSYTGSCDHLIVLIYDKNDIVNIRGIAYKQLFVIIAKNENITNLISLSKLVLRCSDSEIFIESNEYRLSEILAEIRRRMSPDYGFWVACIMLLVVFSFMGIFVISTIYNVFSEN